MYVMMRIISIYLILSRIFFFMRILINVIAVAAAAVVIVVGNKTNGDKVDDKNTVLDLCIDNKTLATNLSFIYQ